MRRRIAASGMGPRAAAMFSSIWPTWDVAGMAQVTAGCDSTNFRKNCAQLRAPNSRPFGQRVMTEALKETAALEGPVNNYCLAAIRSQRQQAIFHLAIEDVVGELHEVQWLCLHDVGEVAVTPPVCGRDP